MRIAFRCDASSAIGSGHVVRCRTLATALRRQGAEVAFLMRRLPGDMVDRLRADGFEVHDFAAGDDAQATQALLAPQPRPDWLVVDHYGLDIGWEGRSRPLAARLMVIDDRPGRQHDCDLLLDPNVSEESDAHWLGRVPARCRVLSGARYCLLRDEFLAARETLRQRDGRVRRILVCFGGSDPDGVAFLALDALSRLAAQGRLEGVSIDVVAGAGNARAEALRDIAGGLAAAAFTVGADDMAARMAAADLAIGGGGGMVWERCYLGLPTLAVILAGNQAETVRTLARRGALWSLGAAGGLDADGLARAIEARLDAPEALHACASKGFEVMGEPDFIRHPLDWLQ